MEYLIVRFRESRKVIIDGGPSGQTNTLLELEAGTHTVSLGPPDNFTPKSQVLLLRGTSALAPKEVAFDAA